MLKISALLGAIGLGLLLLSALPPTTAAPQPAAVAGVPAAQGDVAYGKALFGAKGCVQCHHHAALAESGKFAGSDTPDLTNYRADPTFLRTWLKDPAAVKPATTMPNLGLKSTEIEALIAFLSANQAGS
jgi:cytochrome c